MARLLLSAAGVMRLIGVLVVLVVRLAVVRRGVALLVVVRRAAGLVVERLGVRVVRLAPVLLVVRGMLSLLRDLAAFMVAALWSRAVSCVRTSRMPQPPPRFAPENLHVQYLRLLHTFVSGCAR